jgi:hypothetical protein
VDIIVERCAGLDVAKEEVVACVRGPGEGSRRRQEVRTFLTFTGELEALADWLSTEGVTQVVMEATGRSQPPGRLITPPSLSLQPLLRWWCAGRGRAPVGVRLGQMGWASSSKAAATRRWRLLASTPSS